MKKAGIFAAVIAVVLLFLYFYNYKIFGYTDEAMYVIDAGQAVGYLKNGVKEGEDADFPLKCYQPSTPLYTRGKNYFIGEDYDSLTMTYPVYVNEGNFLYSFSDGMNLIATDFTQLNAYDGLYIASGHSYNQDRSQADPDEFVLLSVEDGLYMNVQDMVIHSQTREHQVSVNSLLNLAPDQISYYQFEDGMYRYYEYEDLLGAQVTIGSLTISYEDLVDTLKGLEDRNDGPEKHGEETETTAVEKSAEETIPETVVLETSEAAEMSSPDGQPEERPETESQTSARENEETTPSVPETGESREILPDHPPVPDDQIQWKFPAFGEEGDGSGEGGNGGSGSSGSGNAGSGSGGSEDGSGDGGTSVNPFQKPEVSVTGFQFGVYHARATLTVTDPAHLIEKGVRLVFYKKGEARASYRKLYGSSGEIQVEPLAPDTEYEVEGYFDYHHPQYGKVREVFLERTGQGKTLPVSALTPLLVAQTPDEQVFSHAIQIRDLQLLQEQETATPSQAQQSDYDASRYISSVQMRFERKGAVEWNSPETVLGSVLLTSLKKGEPVVWKTAEILDSNSRYTYHLKFYDRFGNELPTAKGAQLSGDTRTCKVAPEAFLRISQDSDVSKLEVRAEIVNQDDASFTDGNGKTEPYLYLTYSDKPDTPIYFALSGQADEMTRYELKKSSEKLIFTSLLPSTSYTIWVRGSYDLEDGRIYKDQALGKVLTTTDSLASLGTVNFSIDAADITSTSAVITSRMRSAVSDVLYPYLSELVFQLIPENGETVSVTLKKSELEQEEVTAGQPYVLSDTGVEELAEISVSIPASADPVSVWDALLTNGTLTAACKEGSLQSASTYRVQMQANAVRGGDKGSQVKEDVTGRYRQADFKTMKMPVDVGYDMAFINGSAATFYDMKIHDPDGAVINGSLTFRLRLESNHKVVEIRSYTVGEVNETKEITFSNLEEGMTYVLEIVAQEYNEGYTNTTKQLQKMLYLSDGSQIRFKAENNLSGSLVMDSMKNSFVSQDASQGVTIENNNLFDYNDTLLNKTIAADGSVTTSSGNCASGFIPVEADTLYLIGGGIGNIVNEYDADHKFLQAKNAGAAIYLSSQNVSYVRVTCPTNSLLSGYLSKAMFAEPDSEANLVSRIKEGVYLNLSGVEQNSDKYASTDFIPIEGSAIYVRTHSSGKPNQSWMSRGIFYYDEDKNFLSYTNPDSEAAQVTAPAQARYVRLNLSPDYADQIFFGKRSPLLKGKNLLEEAKWHKGMTVTADNKYTKQQFQYIQYSDYVPVQGSASYYFSTSFAGMQLFDKDKEFLGFVNVSSANLRMPEDVAFVRVNVNFGENYTGRPLLYMVAPPRDRDSLTLGIRLQFDDKGNYLGEHPSFTLEYKMTDEKGKVKEWSETYEADPDSRKYDKILSLDAQRDCQYEIAQTVEIGGNRIVLDTVSVSTDRTSNIVKSEAGLKAVAYAPTDDFIVVNDIEVTSSEFIPLFYGSIDFQGHEVKMRDCYSLFMTLYEGALVENLSADINMDTYTRRLSDRGLIATSNRGTIRNVVLRMSMDNHQNNYTIGGIASSNSGVIDRFAIQLTGNVYAKSYSGGAAGINTGQISNGYLVSEDTYRFTVDAAASADGERTARGGLVGMNREGILKNLYSVVVMEDRYETTAPTNTLTAGMVAGNTRAEIKNVFGVGMTLSNGLPPKVAGPAVGTVSVSQDKIQNISYVETQAFEGQHYINRYNNRVTVASLWDKTWMDQAINEDGAFLTSMASDGYYPQVDMPASMAGKQPVMHLPNRYTSAEPKLLSTSVLEQNEKTARVKMIFDNRSRLQIKSMDIAVMDLKQGDLRNFIPGAKASVIEQGTEADGTYYAIVEISDPIWFRSSYYVSSYVVGIANNDSTNYEVIPEEKEKTEMPVEFYKEITNLDEWRTQFHSSAIDAYGNYRLRAPVFDFGNLTAADFKSNYIISTVFYGKIDGSFLDEQGNQQTTLLKNLDLGAKNGLISDLRGTLKNIRVENLVIDRDEALQTGNKGLVSIFRNGLIDHVQINQAEVHGDYRAGVLVGYAENGAVIRNSSVKNSQVIGFKPTANVNITMGGIVGIFSNGSIENCFADNIEITCMDALESSGIGGIAGHVSGDTVTISNNYATGSIHTGYRYTGGIVGHFSVGSGDIQDNYAKVNIDAYSNFAGGIVGYLGSYRTMQGNLSMGNLFVHSTSSEGVHRLAGYSTIGKFEENFAYAGQMYNNIVNDSDTDDVMELLQADQLSSEDTYKKKLRWSSSDFAFQWENDGKVQSVSDGYMPLLRDTDGNLLPDQTPVPTGSSGIRIEIQELSDNQSAAAEYREMFNGDTPPFTQAYQLQFNLYYDSSAFDLLHDETRMDGMELNGTIKGKQTFSMTWNEDHWVIRYPFVVRELGGDIYCLNMMFQSRTDPDVRISVGASAKAPEGTTIFISNAKEWNEAMKKYGNTYGNFTLTGDVDASTISDELITNVKINKLTGNGTYAIKNLSHEVNGIRDALIATCLSTISGVNFENIQWEVPEDKLKNTYQNVGLIGTNLGTISDVTFQDISIRSGKGNYTGCVAFNMGMLEDIDLIDIQVSSRGSYVGGLTGYTMKEAEQIRAKGTLSQKDRVYHSTYEVSGVSIVGGLIGNGNLRNQSTASGLVVTGIRGTGAGVSYIGGMIGSGHMTSAGQTTEESRDKASYASDLVVQTVLDPAAASDNTSTHLGGIVGNGNVSFGHVTNCLIRNDYGTYAGGLSGSGVFVGSSVSSDPDDADSLIKETQITAKSYAGGLVGTGYGNTSRADRIQVTALESYAGGIAGKTGSTISSTDADRVRVKAPVGAGGIAGQVYNQLSGDLVSRSVIEGGYQVGGLGGENTGNVVNLYNNGVVHTQVIAGKQAETGISNAGGILGAYPYGGDFSGNYTKNTVVTAEGDQAGGLIGYAAGGRYTGCYTTAEVTGASNVGGFIGKLEGEQTALSSTYATMSLRNSYSYAKVKGEKNVSAFVGLYSSGPNKYLPAMENTYGLLAMGEITGAEDASTSLFFNMEDGLAWSGKSLRVFADTLVNGVKAANLPEFSKGDLWWDSYKPASAGGSGTVGNGKLLETLLVTTENLADDRMYTAAYNDGGMYWNTGWDVWGTGRMEEGMESTVNYTPTTTITINGNVIGTDQKLYVVPDGEKDSVTVKMEDGADGYEWFRSREPRLSNYVNTAVTTQETPLKGRGYYFGRKKVGNSYLYTPVIKLDTPERYLPYILGGSQNTRGPQEGLLPGIGTGPDAREKLECYNGLDKLYYGGILIPEGTEKPAAREVTKAETLSVYPSGVDRVNLDLGADHEKFDRILVLCGSKVVCDTSEIRDTSGIRRVYTVPYDYRQSLSVTVYAGTEQQTVSYDASQLGKTVMVWGNEYYYTCDGALNDSRGKALDQEVLNLYGGEALTADGTIYNLETMESRSFAWAEETEAQPLWETSYDGRRLRVMGGFTEIAQPDAQTQQEHETIREQQLLVKDGKLYALTGDSLQKGFVADGYNGQVFASFLDQEGTLRDFGDPLHTPEEFSRKDIAHMSMSLQNEQPYLLVRYANGAAKGFNYVTGEELNIENAFSDVSFLDFAAGFLEDFFGDSDTDNQAFVKLKKLESQLVQAPITDGQLEEAFSVLGEQGNESPAAETEPAAETKPGDETGSASETKSGEETELLEEDFRESDAAADVSGETETEQASRETAVSKEAAERTAEQAAEQASEQTAGQTAEQPERQAETAWKAAEKTAYAYSFDTTKKTAELYRTDDLLRKEEPELLSEQKKAEILQAAGIVTEDYVVPNRSADQESEKGLLIFTVTIILALGLSGTLIYRKRR